MDLLHLFLIVLKLRKSTVDPFLRGTYSGFWNRVLLEKCRLNLTMSVRSLKVIDRQILEHALRSISVAYIHDSFLYGWGSNGCREFLSLNRIVIDHFEIVLLCVARDALCSTVTNLLCMGSWINEFLICSFVPSFINRSWYCSHVAGMTVHLCGACLHYRLCNLCRRTHAWGYNLYI